MKSFLNFGSIPFDKFLILIIPWVADHTVLQSRVFLLAYGIEKFGAKRSHGNAVI